MPRSSDPPEMEQAHARGNHRIPCAGLSREQGTILGIEPIALEEYGCEGPGDRLEFVDSSFVSLLKSGPVVDVHCGAPMKIVGVTPYTKQRPKWFRLLVAPSYEPVQGFIVILGAYREIRDSFAGHSPHR